MADPDPIVEAASAAVLDRRKQMNAIVFDQQPKAATLNAADELMRIRFEMTAIRQLLEKLVAK